MTAAAVVQCNVLHAKDVFESDNVSVLLLHCMRAVTTANAPNKPCHQIGPVWSQQSLESHIPFNTWSLLQCAHVGCSVGDSGTYVGVVSHY